MGLPYFIFRIEIADRDRIKVEIQGPATNKRSLSGTFNYKGDLKTLIQKLHEEARAGALDSPDAVAKLGETLFAILLDGRLGYELFRCYDLARQADTLLRLELDVDERELPEVAALPWEFMRVPPEQQYGTVWLGTAPGMIFSRRRELWGTPESIGLQAGNRLRIALAVAAPQGLGAVKYEKTWQALTELARAQPDRIELLDLVNPATTRSIDQVLEKDPHIFHFLGHGRLRDEFQREVGQIALVDVTGRPHWVGARDFSELFNRHRRCIVLLQACEGAALSTSDAFVGLASQVVQQNIPVVVAMQYEISNATAQRFVIEFYQRLAANDPIDKAVQEGRRTIALHPPYYNRRDFATPVLFMRVENGRLFDIQSDEAGTRRRPVAPTLEETQLEAVYFEGLECFYTDEYERALDCFERVAQAQPDYKDVQQKLTEARRQYERAELETKIRAAQDLSDWGQVIEALQALLTLCPDDPGLADRMAQAQRQMELKKLWEDTAELHRREMWEAVVKSFEKMRAIAPGLPDRENWLAEAQQAIKLKEIKKMVNLHLGEAYKHFDTKDWEMALDALNSVLALDPDNETAAKLRNKAGAEMAQAKSAARLAGWYGAAKKAIDDNEWEDAVGLLNLVSQENPGYQDVARLLERASEQIADAQAKLDVKLSVSPKEAKPDSEVTWTLTINNYSPGPISNIIAVKEGAQPLSNPFTLEPHESKQITFTSKLTTWAERRMRIRVEGTSPLGRPLQAEGKATVPAPPKKKPSKQQPPPTPPKTKGSAPSGKPASGDDLRITRQDKPVTPSLPPTIKVRTTGYREAVRRAKDTVEAKDHQTNNLIDLIEEGEKHYRIALGLISRPQKWDDQFSVWQDAVAKLKPDEIVFVSFAPATPDAILKEMATIAREIERRIGVAIPAQELKNL